MLTKGSSIYVLSWYFPVPNTANTHTLERRDPILGVFENRWDAVTEAKKVAANHTDIEDKYVKMRFEDFDHSVSTCRIIENAYLKIYEMIIK